MIVGGMIHRRAPGAARADRAPGRLTLADLGAGLKAREHLGAIAAPAAACLRGITVPHRFLAV